MTCAGVNDLIQPYLDGELLAEERVIVEQHVVDCGPCRQLIGHESAFKEQLRARLRARPGAEPVGLRAGVLAALDRADVTGEGPIAPLWRRAARPVGGAIVALAAAFAIFVGVHSTTSAAPIVEDAVRGHVKNLPVEIGGTDDEIHSWMQGKVPVAVRPPRFRTASLVGARVYHLASRDAGQIMYRVRGSLVTVYVFDPSGWELSAPAKQMIDGREVFLAEQAGYTVAFYRDHGVGYALVSERSEDELVQLVAASLRE